MNVPLNSCKNDFSKKIEKILFLNISSKSLEYFTKKFNNKTRVIIQYMNDFAKIYKLYVFNKSSKSYFR